MKNYIQPGDTVKVVAPASITSGDGVLVGLLFGIAVTDAGSGDDVQIKTQGVFELPKVSTEVWAPGDLIYWDDGAGNCTTVDTNVAIGVTLADAANPTATGIVRLNGFIAGTVTSV
jgi:predicted RecA/RadA family phage recombinase